MCRSEIDAHLVAARTPFGSSRDNCSRVSGTCRSLIRSIMSEGLWDTAGPEDNDEDSDVDEDAPVECQGKESEEGNTDEIHETKRRWKITKQDRNIQNNPRLSRMQNDEGRITTAES